MIIRFPGDYRERHGIPDGIDRLQAEHDLHKARIEANGERIAAALERAVQAIDECRERRR